MSKVQEKPDRAPKDRVDMRDDGNASWRRSGLAAVVSLLVAGLTVPALVSRSTAPRRPQTITVTGGPPTSAPAPVVPEPPPTEVIAAGPPSTPVVATRGGAAVTRRASSAPAPSPPPAQVTWPARVGAETVGVNAQFLFDIDPAARGPHFQAMRAAGVSVVRRDANWNEIEPRAPASGRRTYDWTRYDLWAAGLAEAGIRWQVTLGYSAVWASSRPWSDDAQFFPPARIDDFTAYASAVARRYGEGGEFWRAHPELPARPVTIFEVWNEQNEDKWWRPRPDPTAYAGLYLATRSAIVGAVPNAIVVVGGLSTQLTDTRRAMSATGFVTRMYGSRPGLRSVVPGIGYHSYAGTSDHVGDVLQNVVKFRAGIDGVHPSVPILLNEFGWATAGSSRSTATVSETDRAEALSLVTDTLARSNCGVTQLLAHTWVGYEDTPYPPLPADSAERWYGIYNRDATPKPSGAAYASTIQRLLGRASQPPDATTVDLC